MALQIFTMFLLSFCAVSLIFRAVETLTNDSSEQRMYDPLSVAAGNTRSDWYAFFELSALYGPAKKAEKENPPRRDDRVKANRPERRDSRPVLNA